MKTPCKHLHMDGALHKPCPDCRVEHLEAENSKLRTQLREVASRLNKLRAEVEGTLWPNSGWAQQPADKAQEGSAE